MTQAVTNIQYSVMKYPCPTPLIYSFAIFLSNFRKKIRLKTLLKPEILPN